MLTINISEHLLCLKSQNAVKHRGRQSLINQTEQTAKRRANLNSTPASRHWGGRRKQPGNEAAGKREPHTSRAPATGERAEGEGSKLADLRTMRLCFPT